MKLKSKEDFRRLKTLNRTVFTVVLKLMIRQRSMFLNVIDELSIITILFAFKTTLTDLLKKEML